MKKRILSLLLAVTMVLQLGGGVLAEDIAGTPQPVDEEIQSMEETYQGCIFNFSAAKYVLSEADESYEILVKREGDTALAADVVFKAIDVYAAYGEDYTILDEEGEPLEKSQGIVLPPETAKRLAEATREAAEAENEPIEDGEETPHPQTADNIFSARNALLGIDTAASSEEIQEVKDEVQRGIETVNKELSETEGVSGVLHFSEGEIQKSITVLPVDNQMGSADKTVLLVLLGASAGSVAPNPTAALTIMDDEEYVPPVFEMAEGSLTLDEEQPQGELTIRRVSGEDYYSTVLVSTYSMTAQGGVDFTAMNDHQVVFAPGEMEKAVPVEGLNFTYSGTFGVRLTGDGSCEIGEKDRAIVHLVGEGPAPEKPEEEPDLEAVAQAFALMEATAPLEETPWDGILGAKQYSVKTARVRRFGTDPHSSWDGYTLGYRPGIEFGKLSGYPGYTKKFELHVELGLESRANANIESVTLTTSAELMDPDVPTQEMKRYGYLYGAKRDKSKEWTITATEKPQIHTLTIDWPQQKSYEGKVTYAFGQYAESDRYENRLSMALTGAAYNFKHPYAVHVVDAPLIKSAPYINLNTTGGAGSEWQTDYQPPKLTVKNEDGKGIDAFYPSDEIINISTNTEELSRHGLYLNAVTVSTKTLSDSDLESIKRTGYSRSSMDAVYLTASDNRVRVSSMDLISKMENTKYLNGDFSGLYFYPDYRAQSVTVHIVPPSTEGTYLQAAKGEYTATTGAILQGRGYAGAGQAITGYAVYANNNPDDEVRTLVSIYRHPTDASLLGDVSNLFYLPCPSFAAKHMYLVPLAEFQGLEFKPHPSTKNETIYETVTVPKPGGGTEEIQREVTYGERIYLTRPFTQGDDPDSTNTADQNGEIKFDRVNGGDVYSLKSVTPKGYITEWINGTMDFDEDGVIDNAQGGGMTQQQVDSLYTPVYGSQFIYQVNQVNPKYYYRFTKFDPSRLLDGKTRTGYVKQDSRTILDYDGSAASYGDLIPCAKAEVLIGENKAETDDTGKYVIKMDGIPDAVRVSTAVRTGSGTFVTHIQSNVENNITIPFYDTFEPVGVTATYVGEKTPLARAISISDKELTVTIKVRHTSNGMYIKNAAFYIQSSNGKVAVDCSENEAYKVTYQSKGDYGYATLKFNPKVDMVSGNRIFVRFVDQNGAEHRAMDVGYHFIEQLDLGDFVLGAIGSTSFAENDVVVDLLDSAMFDMDLGQISGFQTYTTIIEPEARSFDKDGKPNTFDATVYSYYNEIHSENFGGGGSSGGEGKSASLYADHIDEGASDPALKAYPKDPAKNAVPPERKIGALTSNLNEGKAAALQNNKKIDEPNGVGTGGKNSSSPTKEATSENGVTQAEQEPPKSASFNNAKKASVASAYNYELTPSIQFDMVITSRTVKDENGDVMKDKDGNEIYKEYFEEMSLGIGLGFDVQGKVEISLPLGISVMIKPTLSGSVQGIYYLKTDYKDDKFWTERPIEYTPGSFSLFSDPGDSRIHEGYIYLMPSITIDVGVKVAIVEVDVGGTFNFDMGFKFEATSLPGNYGTMQYDIHINLLILNFNVFSKKLYSQTVELFGEHFDKPMEQYASQAIAEAFSSGDATVKPAGRDYLDDRSAWRDSGAGEVSLLAGDEILDEDDPADRLLQSGVMPGGEMASAMLGRDTMFVAYVDDDPSRGADDRSRIYYTYTQRDGSWMPPAPIEDDGTLDKEPVVYDLGDRLLVAWLSADEVIDGGEYSPAKVSRALNSLNVHAAFFDKEAKTFGEICQVTQTTEQDTVGDGNIVITKTGADSLRVYYTKTEYAQDPENVDALIAASSVIAYRDYDGTDWSEEYTKEEQQTLTESGNEPGEYTRQWYGQRFADTRTNGRWSLVTDLEADFTDAWQYFAFIADEDGNYNTSGDRRVYLTFEGFDKPVCVTPEAGAYDDLQFCYSGSELMLAFKTDQIKINASEGEKRVGGVSYVNLSEVFEKQTYDKVESGELGCYVMAFADTVEWDRPTLYEPEAAVVMEGMVQKYELFADRGGRMYVLWTDNTLSDDGTSSIQIYASVYNGDPAWTEDAEAAEGSAVVRHAKWSLPVLLTSPLGGGYQSFTAQSVAGDGIALVAKRTATDGASQLVFHLRAPYAGFLFSEGLTDTKYVYEGRPVNLGVEITNGGLMAAKTESLTDADGVLTWRALPGTYQIDFERLVDGEAVEILSTETRDMVWGVGDTLSASCQWLPQELPDNMDLQVTVTDLDTGEVLCGETLPVVKAVELDLGRLTARSTQKNRAKVTFNLCNNGNIPVYPTAIISVLDESGKKTELARSDLEELLPLETAPQELALTIDEAYQTIADGKGHFRLAVEILEGEAVSFVTETEGDIHYSQEAMEAVAVVESLSVDKTSLALRKAETAQVTTGIFPASAAENNKVKLVSSDESVVSVLSDNTLKAVGSGSATIMAYAIPKMGSISVAPDGSTKVGDMQDGIPDSMIQRQEIQVTVTGASSGGGSGKPDTPQTGAPVELKPSATAGADGSANVDVTEKDLTAAADQAAKQGADAIVVEPQIKGEAGKVTVELPASTLAGLQDKTKADLVVKTLDAAVTIPNAGLSELAGNGVKQIAVSTERQENGDVVVTVSRDGESVQKLSTGIKVELPVTAPKPGDVLVLVGDDGTETVVKTSVGTETGLRGLLDGSTTLRVKDNTKTFADVPADFWGADEVAFAASRELFQGTGPDTFSPGGDMTRAMFFTVLARLDGQDTAGGGTWYSKAMDWAKTVGVSDGTNPDGGITREQLAVMLYRYGGGVQTGGSLSAFGDGAAVSSWAADAMGWAVEQGIITGRTGGLLDPKGEATRAEVAAMLMRFLKSK